MDTTITPEDIKRLREQTGAGIMDCKRALEASGGDVEQAVAWLRAKGLSAAAKKAGRVAREGVIASYIHHGSRLGVLLELNCETDFVARTDDFTQLARELAIQVAGLNPTYVGRDAVPAVRRGVPALAILTAGFIDGAELLASALGAPGYAFVVIEHPIANASDEQLEAKARDTLEQAERLLGW